MLALLLGMTAGTARAASGSVSASAGAVVGRTAAAARAGVLFQWRFPAKGHTGDWAFGKGIMSFGGDTPGYAFPHITLKNAANFAVEASMRSPGPGGAIASLAGFGLILAHSTSNPHTAISGGSFFSTQSEDNNAELYWNGDTVGGAAFDPGSAWHAYRIEVHANLYTLLIDGKQMVQYPIDDYAFPTRVGVFSLYRQVQVRWFRVLSLPSAGGTTSHAPPLKPLALTLADLPTSDYFQPLLHHYSTNVETAREQNVSAESLDAAGHISTYIVSWFPWGTDFFDLYSALTAFRTPANAQASIMSRLQTFQAEFSSFPNFRLLPDQHVGDTSGGIRLDVVADTETFHAVALLFSRGSYTVLLRAVFYGNVLSESEELARVVTLAKIIDGKISSISPAPRRSARTSQPGR